MKLFALTYDELVAIDALPVCPTCSATLELYANGDNGPQDDRWSCATCGIEYPHTRFPLPMDYVKDARAHEQAQALADRHTDDLAKLAAWNAAAHRTP